MEAEGEAEGEGEKEKGMAGGVIGLGCRDADRDDGKDDNKVKDDNDKQENDNDRQRQQQQQRATGVGCGGMSFRTGVVGYHVYTYPQRNLSKPACVCSFTWTIITIPSLPYPPTNPPDSRVLNPRNSTALVPNLLELDSSAICNTHLRHFRHLRVRYVQ